MQSELLPGAIIGELNAASWNLPSPWQPVQPVLEPPCVMFVLFALSNVSLKLFASSQ
jgi:hypothetical protein